MGLEAELKWTLITNKLMNAAALTSTGNTQGVEQLQAYTPAAAVASQAAAGPGCSRRGPAALWAEIRLHQQVPSLSYKRFAAPPVAARPGPSHRGQARPPGSP